MRLLKAKVLEDIEPPRRKSPSRGPLFIGGRSVFRRRASRVNLGFRKVFRVPLTRCLKAGVVMLAAWFLVLGSVAAPTTPTLAANSANDTERAALESQLKDLETQINQYQNQITSYQKQGNSLKGEITTLNNKIAKLNLQIKAVNLSLAQLDLKIADTQIQITATETDIDRNRTALGDLLLNQYETDHVSLIEVFLKNPKLSDFFSDVNSIALVQNGVRTAIQKITDLKTELTDQKEQFALARADAATLRDYQLTQKTATDQIKQQKNDLLAATKGQESKYQAILRVTKETAAKIRSRIFQLLGGGQLSFEDAYQFAKLAGAATGVRPALILAVLDRESALGQNVGKCGYQTAMNPKDRPIFLQITASLNINPDTITVSCPNADGIYGGAMGPSQFIPSTWMLYADAVSKITGRTPASPWNNADAFVATALYLKDAGAAQNERIAAAKYYCGSRWNRYVCTQVYGQKVIEQAAQFQEDINTITG